MTTAKLMLKDATNYCLSYLLSQPVDFDIMIVIYFVMEYAGVFLWMRWSKDVLGSIQTPMNMVVRKLQRSSC